MQVVSLHPRNTRTSARRSSTNTGSGSGLKARVILEQVWPMMRTVGRSGRCSCSHWPRMPTLRAPLHVSHPECTAHRKIFESSVYTRRDRRIDWSLTLGARCSPARRWYRRRGSSLQACCCCSSLIALCVCVYHWRRRRPCLHGGSACALAQVAGDSGRSRPRSICEGEAASRSV